MPGFTGVGAGRLVPVPPAPTTGDAEVYMIGNSYQVWKGKADGTVVALTNIINNANFLMSFASVDHLQAYKTIISDLHRYESNDGGTTWSDTTLSHSPPAEPTDARGARDIWVFGGGGEGGGILRSLADANYTFVEGYTNLNGGKLADNKAYTVEFVPGTPGTFKIRVSALDGSGLVDTALTNGSPIGAIGDKMVCYDRDATSIVLLNSASVSTPTGLPSGATIDPGRVAYNGATAMLSVLDGDVATIYRSTGGGASWTSVKTWTIHPDLGSSFWLQLAYAPTAGIWWSMGAYTGSGSAGFWRSGDDGDTWTFVAGITEVDQNLLCSAGVPEGRALTTN